MLSKCAVALTLLLAATCSGAPAPLQKRDSTAIINAVNTVKADLTTLTDAVSKFAGDEGTGMPVYQAAYTLDYAVYSATDAVNAVTGNFSPQDSKDVAKATNELAGLVIAALEKVKNTKDLITNVEKLGMDFISYVVSEIQSLETDNDNFMTAVKGKTLQTEFDGVNKSGSSTHAEFESFLTWLKSFQTS